MSEAIASILSTSSDTAQMRLLASSGDAAVNEEVLQQFEALFLQQMLKSMRTASLGDGLFQSEQTEFYRDMYDQHIATDLAKRGIVGISNLIGEQLGVAKTEEQSTENELLDSLQASVSGSLSNNLFANSVPLHVDETTSSETRALAFNPNTPQEFVEYAQQHTDAAAKRLGVSADVIIAIAALETGWGQHVPADSNGSSNNYFGIKADQSWQGEQVNKDTLEFADGVFNKIEQPFRVYENLAQSFNDFAEFLLGNERYAKALEFAHDSKQFLQEIQNAGYATDPQYANKILKVLSNKVFSAN